MEIVGNPILDTGLGPQVAGGADLVGVGVGLEPAECGCLGSRKVGVDLSLVSIVGEDIRVAVGLTFSGNGLEVMHSGSGVCCLISSSPGVQTNRCQQGAAGCSWGSSGRLVICS